MRARFDDHRPGHEKSWRLTGPVASGETTVPGDVAAVVRQAAAHAEEGRWVAWLVGYEAAAGLRSELTTLPPGGPAPLAWFGAFEDAVSERTWEPAGPYSMTPWHLDADRSAYRQALAAIRDAIARGDTYQVNFTSRLRFSVDGDLQALYRELIESQSGGYGACITTDDWAIVSASPELFFRWDRDGTITTRPMKGTRRRGRTPEEDEQRRLDLADSAKDRAENVMIVDMLRNDLGRVCEFGTVQAPRLFDIEKYDTVWQLTSEVSGRLRPGVGLVDVLTALFPSGSVTGAPKRRTMELIAALEASPRGVYCGAVGLLSPDPSMPRAQCNVAIRTIEVDRRNGGAVYGSGGGITWDSDVDQEWNELHDKAAVLELGSAGLGLIETMRYDPGEGVVRAEGHLDRMAASAAHFGIPFDRMAAAARLAELDASRSLRVRLTAARSGRLELEVLPFDADPGPVVLAIDDVPVRSDSPFLYHKTTRRDVYEEAAARHPQAGDVVLVNEQEHVTETTRANLAVRLDGTWWTPPVADGLLPGVLRGELVAAGLVHERSLEVSDLVAAEAIEVISSLRGRRPAVLAEAATDPARPAAR